MKTAESKVPPVLFIIFNRPELTQKVFDSIREVKPSRLFVAADGAREKMPNDFHKCQRTREIIGQIDWDCDVQTLLREENLGCRVAVSSAIEWFFENVDEGIILEDDCLPSRSFFYFCHELLERYREDERVMQINGNFYLAGLKEFKDSYYFSKLAGCWGWATWKRAWKHFDSDMKSYSRLKKEGRIDEYYNNSEISIWMKKYLDEAVRPSCNIWSTQWSYVLMKKKGLCITPTVNLVQNIGFTAEATSGNYENFQRYTDFVPENIYDLVHPDNVFHDKDADALQFESIIKITDPKCMNTFNLSLMRVLKRCIPQQFKNQIKILLFRH